MPTSSPSSVGTSSHTDPELVWTKYCGFLELSLSDFIDIQQELLLEQINLIHASALGRRMLVGRVPKSVSEFRTVVPLTTYKDYSSYLSPDNEGVLSEKPAVWAHTVGGHLVSKEVPYTQRGLERLLDSLMGCFILAAASYRGEVKVWPGDMVLYNTPERPYLSGIATFGMAERFGFRGVLDPEVSERLEFKERVRQGFKVALGQKVDVLVSLTSVLVKTGEDFTEQARHTRPDRSALRPLALLRLARAYWKSRFLGRPILPKDLWPAKAIVGWGMDTSFFRDKVKYYWGKDPFEFYAGTEGGVMGMQTWRKQGLVFSPYADFVEFIPVEEARRSQDEKGYQPNTVLLDEVVPGKTYEMVITNFYGMPLVRYRMGHLVQFLPMDNLEPGIHLPQFRFLGRTDDRIDIGGFTRIDERAVWEALNLTELEYGGWTLRKEFDRNTPVLHMYIELKKEYAPEVVETVLHQKLKEVDRLYSDLESMLGIRPLRVTCLPFGTLERFYDFRQRAGAELTKLAPPRINASDEDVEDLLRMAALAKRASPRVNVSDEDAEDLLTAAR